MIIAKIRTNQVSNNFCSNCFICSSPHWSALSMTQKSLLPQMYQDMMVIL